jgi:Tat protein secretion system quality control protein TatD with DNase activity
MHTLATLAVVRGETEEELEARIDENASTLFGLDRA